MSGGMGKIIFNTKASGAVKPFWAKFKKHYCFSCNNKLVISKITHYGIVKGSIEAENKNLKLPFDLSNHPLDYTFTIFECPKCGCKLSIDDQYEIENSKKKKRFQYDDYHEYLKSIDRKNGTDLFEDHLNFMKKGLTK